MENITYTWNFNPLEVMYHTESLQNIVQTVHWQLHATHEETTTTVQTIGTISLEPPAVENFIPFENLTKETVTYWVETVLGTDYINGTKTNLSQSLNELLFPVKGRLSPPWQTVEPSTSI